MAGGGAASQPLSTAVVAYACAPNGTIPSGSPAVGNAPGNQTTATFTSSGEYTVVVNGKTDWGSVFAIKKTLPVGVE